MEAYLRVDNASVIAAGLTSAAQNSINTYGVREAKVENKQIVALGSGAYAWAASWFNQFAVLLGRTKVTLDDEQVETPNPGNATLIRVSGSSNDIADQYATKTTYKWTGKLGVDIELTTQRPTIEKMILSAALASGGGGSASATGIVAGQSSSSQAGGNGGGSGGIRLQTDSFTSSFAGPFTLTQTPSGTFLIVFTDAGIEDDSNYTVSGSTLTWASGYDSTQIGKRVKVVYSY
jgi:hypothetical protein